MTVDPLTALPERESPLPKASRISRVALRFAKRAAAAAEFRDVGRPKENRQCLHRSV